MDKEADLIHAWRERFGRNIPESALNVEVPTDDELREMQKRGELPSDEELEGEES